MEYVSLGRVVLAFAIVLALMLGLAWAARRFGVDKRFRGEGRELTMSTEEVLYLDPRRRIVIVKRRSRRYVLLLGTQQEILLESYDEQEKAG